MMNELTEWLQIPIDAIGEEYTHIRIDLDLAWKSEYGKINGVILTKAEADPIINELPMQEVSYFYLYTENYVGEFLVDRDRVPYMKLYAKSPDAQIYSVFASVEVQSECLQYQLYEDDTKGTDDEN